MSCCTTQCGVELGFQRTRAWCRVLACQVQSRQYWVDVRLVASVRLRIFQVVRGRPACTPKWVNPSAESGLKKLRARVLELLDVCVHGRELIHLADGTSLVAETH